MFTIQIKITMTMKATVNPYPLLRITILAKWGGEWNFFFLNENLNLFPNNPKEISSVSLSVVSE